MKKRIFLGIIVGLIILMTGCGKDVLPNTYVPGSDYQYMQLGGFDFFPRKQKGENGYYLKYLDHVYYFDEISETILPLCNRIDCLHDKEIDMEKYVECNAYIPSGDSDSSVGIGYCNGSIYCMSNETIPILYRMTADGSKKEQVYQWKDEGIIIEQWIVHRDVFYYVEHAYVTGVDGVSERYSLNAIDLKGVAKPRTLYTADESLSVMSLAYPQAYGNYLYFQIVAYTDKNVEITDENYMDYLYLKTFIVDLEKEEVTELRIEKMEKGERIQGVVFWQDRILFSITNDNKEYLDSNTWYIADLDGSNAEIFMENIEYGYQFHTDEKYIYLSNMNMVDMGYEDGEKKYRVYDGEKKLVDTIVLPFESYGALAIGDEERMYIVAEFVDGGWGVAYWDKENIGSYNDEAFELIRIKYGEYY